MPKKLAAVTKQEVIEYAVNVDVMPILYSALGTITVIIPCIKHPETNAEHICYYNIMLEKGWLEELPENEYPPNIPPEIVGNVYVLTRDGSDNFCRQHLTHSNTEGPVVDLVKEWFERDPGSLKTYKEDLMRDKINQELV